MIVAFSFIGHVSSWVIDMDESLRRLTMAYWECHDDIAECLPKPTRLGKSVQDNHGVVTPNRLLTPSLPAPYALLAYLEVA